MRLCKRILILLLLSAASGGAWAEDNVGQKQTGPRKASTKDYYLGDANLDGELNMADVVTIQAYLSDKDPKVFRMETADADKSGTVDQEDIDQIIQWILEETDGGMITVKLDDSGANGSISDMPWG